MAQKKTLRSSAPAARKPRISQKVGSDTYYYDEQARKVMVQPPDGVPYAPDPREIPEELRQWVASR